MVGAIYYSPDLIMSHVLPRRSINPPQYLVHILSLDVLKTVKVPSCRASEALDNIL